jgi:HEAT repeat protein
VSDDVATDQGRDGRAEIRRRRVTMAGHGGDAALARRGLADPDPGVRAAALGALARLGALTAPDVQDALAGGEPAVRRRAVEVALTARGTGIRSSLPRAVADALGDPDPLVVVNAAWFLAERRARAAVAALATTATNHDDARCREAAVAALGAIGDPLGLPAVLQALHDTPTVRRRATVALAGFDDPRVTPALRAAIEDRDWQVRQAAGELLDEPSTGNDAAEEGGAAASPRP